MRNTLTIEETYPPLALVVTPYGIAVTHNYALPEAAKNIKNPPFGLTGSLALTKKHAYVTSGYHWRKYDRKPFRRALSLLDEGRNPRYMDIRDNGGETQDRYTVWFTGRYAGRNGRTEYVAMSDNPFGAQGFCQHGEIEGTNYSRAGKKITFDQLPYDCQRVAMWDYLCTWGICTQHDGVYPEISL